MDPSERRVEPFGQGIYSPEFTRRTYDAMLARAEPLLVSGQSVVLDGTFHQAEERLCAVSVAERTDAPLWLVECTLPTSEARRRLEARSRRGDAVSDGRWELYQRQQAQWEPVQMGHSGRYVRLETTGAPQETAKSLLRLLYLKLLE